ncbi:MAG TPA: D-glycerate dehydrogenase [Thermotogota bacterium]|nr:D-glycerate dehydrogenase [Thermotogota bacterium]
MKREKIFITRKIPIEGIAELEKYYDVEVWGSELPIPPELFIEKIKDAAGVICMLSDKVTKEVIDSAPELRVITNYAVGYDNIAVEYAKSKGIKVGNTPGVLTETTADLAFSLLMSVARRITESADYVKAGEWKTWGPQLMLGNDIWGRTMGIIGFGRIGQAMARRARGFGMKVLYYSRTRKPDAEEGIGVTYTSLEEIYENSDFISLHSNLTPSTNGMIGKEQFDRMKRNCILINTARGAMIKTADLIEALETRKIAGAGLDVTDPEPINMDSKLLELSNCIIVPHIGSASYQTRNKMSRMVAENIIAGINGHRLPYEV